MTTDKPTNESIDLADNTAAASIADLADMANMEGENQEQAQADTTPAMRIVRIQNCASLSGRSTLTYHIGTTQADSTGITAPEIQLRIFANTAKGFFCKDWVSLTLLGLMLMEAKSFSSSTVQRMFFQGKSVNSGGFVLAALRHEGLIRVSEGSLRSYERLDPTAWQQEISALIEAGVSLSEHQTPDAVPVGKAAKKGKPLGASQLGAGQPVSRKKAA